MRLLFYIHCLSTVYISYMYTYMYILYIAPLGGRLRRGHTVAATGARRVCTVQLNFNYFKWVLKKPNVLLFTVQYTAELYNTINNSGPTKMGVFPTDEIIHLQYFLLQL